MRRFVAAMVTVRRFCRLLSPENLFAFRDATDANRLLVRNLAAEKEAIARLERAGFARIVDGYEMRDARRVVRFFAFDFPALPPEWKISVAPGLEKASHELEPVAPTIEIVRSGEDWFELKYSVATEAGEGIPLAEVQRLLRSGQNQTRLKNGKIAVLNPEALDDFEQVLRDADPRQGQPGVYRLNKIQAGYLTNTAEEIGAQVSWRFSGFAQQRCPWRHRATRSARPAVARLPTRRRVLALGARGAKSRRNPGRRDGPRQNGANARLFASASRPRSGLDCLSDFAPRELATRGGTLHSGFESAADRRIESLRRKSRASRSTILP